MIVIVYLSINYSPFVLNLWRNACSRTFIDSILRTNQMHPGVSLLKSLKVPTNMEMTRFIDRGISKHVTIVTTLRPICGWKTDRLKQVEVLQGKFRSDV